MPLPLNRLGAGMPVAVLPAFRAGSGAGVVFVIHQSPPNTTLSLSLFKNRVFSATWPPRCSTVAQYILVF